MEKLKQLDAGTVSRMVILLIALINQILLLTGHELIPLNENLVYEFISLVFLFGATALGFWKNNNFTPEAKVAQKKLKQLKKNKKYAKSTGAPIIQEDTTGGNL